MRHLATLLLSLVLAAQTWAQTERWHVVKLQGERAGWARTAERTEGALITTEGEMEITMARGPARVTVRVSTEFVETADGQPISMFFEQALGGVPVTSRVRFANDGTMTLVSSTGGVEGPEQVYDAPTEPWLTPAAAARALRDAIASGKEALSVITLEPTSGINPITIEYSGFEQTEVEAWGKTVPAYRVSVTHSLVPGAPSVEYLDAEGTVVRSKTTLGGMEIEMLAAERALALADVDPPEIMKATFVRPDRDIDRPRTCAQGVYILHLPGAELTEPPSAGAQRVERIDGSTVRVSVRAGRASPAGETEVTRALADSTMLDLDDERIAALVERARPAAGMGERERAEAMRRFVYQHISGKSLGVGFATASEVARTRVGDCTEHAVLLAAMLRRDGIPARVVNGLVYADSFVGSKDIFGYHMWTQAALPGARGLEWVDLDATLSRAHAFDATHIGVLTSTLADGEEINAMLALAPLLGALEISVIDAQQEGGR